MSDRQFTQIDPAALKALLKTFWESGQWRDEKDRKTSPVDLTRAKQAGIMFDPVLLSHQDVVLRVLRAVSKVDRQAVANAFVVSLASRRLDYRSALGSYAVFQHFYEHEPPQARKCCRICGIYNSKPELEDLNVLSFERFKWGGVRHDDPLYASLDLELFLNLSSMVPSQEDLALFSQVIDAIDKAPLATTSATLEKHFAKTVASNKAERDGLVAILGFCGILETETHPGYRSKFIGSVERDSPDRHFVDMSYPACWWRRSDGINRHSLRYWFGHLMAF